MSTCEKCWRDAHSNPYEVSATYRALIDLRDAEGRGCTPEEQAGPDATPRVSCGGRLTRHQYTKQCMVVEHSGR
jgi:hypothetical protein